MQFGVSYFGVRNPQHFQRDLEEIARLGFTSIIFTFSEEDHRFYQGSLVEFVRRTQQQDRHGRRAWSAKHRLHSA